MGKIQILDENLIKKIAAGEVVERPASVVKELVENSIDAEASSIRVAIRAGGKHSIVVVDDGVGMHKEDLVNAFERFATSKIENEKDLSNINTSTQIIIAGKKENLVNAMDLASRLGAKRAILLKVSVPSHCVLMSSASKKLRNLLKTTNFDSFSVPVISNVNVEEYQDQSDLLEGLSNQVCMPVRWGETIQYFKNQGVRICIEFGPGGVLSGLCRRIDSSIKVIRYDSIDACKEINEENLK